MEDKKLDDTGWSQVSQWFNELIEQARTNAKRWFIAFVITLITLILTNAYWIYTLNSYEYVYQDGSGQNNYNNNVDGDINNVTTGEEEKER